MQLVGGLVLWAVRCTRQCPRGSGRPMALQHMPSLMGACCARAAFMQTTWLVAVAVAVWKECSVRASTRRVSEAVVMVHHWLSMATPSKIEARQT